MERDFRNRVYVHGLDYRSSGCIDGYPIPIRYSTCLQQGLREHPEMTAADNVALDELKNLFGQQLSYENYGELLHMLLWLEESGAKTALSLYDLKNVNIQLVFKQLEIAVPGLAEKRPSILPYDKICIKAPWANVGVKTYVCKVKYVRESKLIISDVDRELMDMITTYPSLKMDVSFVLSRMPFIRMHQGIDEVFGDLQDIDLFPTWKVQNILRTNNFFFQLPHTEIMNKRITANNDQLCAVRKIVNCSSKNAPYILFGPPGTGKTETLVEAILQVMNKSTLKILVCAPSNSACDMLALRLVEHCASNEMIRLHSGSREKIPEGLQKYSNQLGRNPWATELSSYRIVVSTVINIGRYLPYDYHPDFIFIDEAAQLTEPEVCVPLGLFPKAQLILAGDPKQLGPICANRVAANLGLGRSVLERLMEYDIYKNHDPNYIMMLKNNYRSHPDILRLPNKLFYENKLKAYGDSQDPISRINIFPLINKSGNISYGGYANEFCSVMAEEQQDSWSPSYFNYKEAQMVVKYVVAMLNLDLGDYKIIPSEIGIVTPYRRQVHEIKGMLKKIGREEIEVGSVEVFQGREKRIVIVSSVRARQNLLWHDKKFGLGFVSQPNRFNVAITRAKSKLIVVGCPIVLKTDDKWSQFMEMCEAANSYYESTMANRTKEATNHILPRYRNGMPLRFRDDTPPRFKDANQASGSGRNKF